MGYTRIVAIIPARMAASRFPGKPLLSVCGLPMVEHVRRRTLLCKGFSEVVVATCDREIADVVEKFGGSVVMTSSTHPAASDRVAEAMRRLDCTNVQGDEILVLPEDLDRLVEAVAVEPEVSAWNAVAKIEGRGELEDPSIVKCVVSLSNRILFCSRNFSSLPLSNGRFDPVRKVLGILAFSRSFLQQYGTMRRTPLEIAESIDQSRIVEHDVVLRAVEYSKGYLGINEPREVEVVERCLVEDVRQREVLAHILSA
ncbi:MAG: 3-deoxy-manno-octulosonate cytidylyltransferase [Nitrospirae bacterium]|nr:3-deoxy-manno-octulosonate cytidylyltransferase [Nitrospirota bacterium]